MKLPFSFSLKFIFRLLLPGFVATLSFVPVLQTVLKWLRVAFPIEWAFLLACVALGWLFVVLDMQIYMLFEGRRYWPRPVRRLFLRLERSRLRRVELTIQRTQGSSHRRYVEASVEIRRFPMNRDGRYTVSAPTRIGNLISAYEDYSLRIYGMDAVFFWPRIWLKLEENQRKEIDDQQALADSVVYSSAATYLAGLTCGLYALLQWLLNQPSELLPGPAALLGLGLSCLSGGYLLYRIAIHIQANFGETFKAVFDNFHDQLDMSSVVADIRKTWPEAVPPGASPAELNVIAWRYLQNYRVRLKEGVVPASRLKLPH